MTHSNETYLSVGMTELCLGGSSCKKAEILGYLNSLPLACITSRHFYNPNLLSEKSMRLFSPKLHLRYVGFVT